MSRKAKPSRGRKSNRRRVGDIHRRLGKRTAKPREIVSAPRRKAAKKAKRPHETRERSALDPRLEASVLEMNRGRSLSATARELQIPRKTVQAFLRKHRLAKRGGSRWIINDKRPRRVPVMTGGRIRLLIVPGYREARLVGEHHYAAGEFLRTNDLRFLKPFKGESVQALNGRRYALETGPNALHRIAAMDSPPFHEIYEITSNT